MESTLPRPSKIRKRANKACLACRARKVRCDVSQRGRPCMNCFLDSESCVVVDRASRRRKSTEEDVNGDAASENVSAERMCHRGSMESGGEAPEQADGDVRMEATSDGGSYGPDVLPHPASGFAAVNSSSSIKRPALMSELHAAQHGAPQHLHSSTRARSTQLQWAGEHSTLFGAEVTYSYYPFLEIRHLSRVLPQDVSYLEMQGCLRVPKKTFLDEFVKQYFLHVHPIMPLVNEGDFWESYGSAVAESSDTERTSLLVFQAMLFAACAYVPRNTVRDLGFPNVKAARAAFYRRAKFLFDFDAESSPIAIAQAALLLSSWSPSATRHCTQTGSFWLAIAIQQAKSAGAHQYKSLYERFGAESRLPAAVKRRNILKRLWWCTIVSDRMQCLCAQKPMLVTVLHFTHEQLRDSFTLTDFADEIERSRVYNSGAKRTLIQMFMQMTDLARVLTDLLTEVLPPDEGNQWDRGFSEGEKNRIEESKKKMESWYEATRGLRFPVQDSMEAASRHWTSQPAVAFAHDSVVLYTNFMSLVYQSAMVRLSHYECFRMVAQARRVDTRDTVLPEKRLITEKQHELQKSAYGVVMCLKTLTQNRLTRWLPLNTIALVSLPLILNIIDVKLSSQPGVKLDALHDLYDSMRAYQPQLDTTDWVADSIRRILDRSGLHRLDRTAIPSTSSEDSGIHRDAQGLHPSLYLRLAVVSMLDVPADDLLWGRMSTDDGLFRIFVPALIDRIKSILNRDAQVSKTTSARVSGSTSTAEDHAMRQRIAAWQAQDQAVSLELGFDPADLAVPGAEGAGSLVVPSSAEEEGDTNLWKDAIYRAFSSEGDARETSLLGMFVFRDQTMGANGTSQFEWPIQGTSLASLDQEAHSISPEAAQGGDVDMARLESTERV